jgi:UDP-N-acetylglucosamine 1-carboxyvinyltransferase
VTLKLREAGVIVEEGKDWISVRVPERLRPFFLETAPYPGFPTDMQAQLMAVATLADGSSFITETIFENRMLHVGELRRMGADITVKGSSAVVRGVETLSGAPLMASDLRASAALVLAGLAAEGRTEVSRAYHLDRGYERLEEKLQAFGAAIWREEE